MNEACKKAWETRRSRYGPCGHLGAYQIARLPKKPFRPHRPERYALLIELARQGRKHREIAAIYGGTPHGVRSNLRRLRERGAL